MSKLNASLIALATLVLGVIIGWLGTALDDGITATYLQSSIQHLEIDRNNLRDHVLNRNNYETDFLTLQSTQDKQDRIFEKKYENWYITSIGLVKFGVAGDIKALCFSDLNPDLICDDLIKADKVSRKP